MPQRFTKQLVYGASFVSVVLIIIVVIFVVALRRPPSCTDNILNQNEEEVDCGGPCISCDFRHLVPLRAGSVFIFPGDGANSVALTEVSNPNFNYGAETFAYTLTFTDGDGKVLKTLDRESFIYPGEIKQVLTSGVPLAFRDFARVEMKIHDPVWRPIREFVQPHFRVRERNIETDSVRREAVVSGLAVNENAYSVGTLLLIAVIYNANGEMMNVGTTIVNDLVADGERFFRIVVPDVNQGNLDQGRTEVFFESKHLQ